MFLSRNFIGAASALGRRLHLIGVKRSQVVQHNVWKRKRHFVFYLFPLDFLPIPLKSIICVAVFSNIFYLWPCDLYQNNVFTTEVESSLDAL